MHLYDVPIVFVFAGLALYTLLGGADFGAGIWQLVSFLTPARTEVRRRDAAEIRGHLHHAIGPVWEANHVWLIFVLTVTWTAYPRAFGAITSTLFLPLLAAGVGIIFRGATYALRSATAVPREVGLIDTGFSLASFLTPFALGTIVGAIAVGRVPPGNAAGGLVSAWLNPVSILCGVLFVAIAAYLAAVYLAADAQRHGEAGLEAAFRRRALAAAAIAGVLALVTLAVLEHDAHRLETRLLTGPGLAGVILSLAGGLATVGLVVARRFGAARISAAVTVVGLIAGWALAQAPTVLPGLSLGQAAAPDATLIALLVAIGMGVIVLFPSLGLLFSLVLSGTFDRPEGTAATGAGEVRRRLSVGVSARVSLAGLLGGLGFLTLADPPWCHIIGVLSLLVCAVGAFLAIDPFTLADAEVNP